MEWLRSHPFRGAGFAFVLLVVCLLVFGVRVQTPVQTTGSWGGTGALVGPISYDQTLSYSQGISSEGVDVVFPQASSTRPRSSGRSISDPGVDWDAFIASLSTKGKASPQSSGKSFDSGYEFLLGGGRDTTLDLATSSARSPEQEALYVYGNAVGEKMQSFEVAHPSMPDILQAQAEHPSDPGAIAALKQLAGDFLALSKSIASVSQPAVLGVQGQRLVDGYAGIAAKLAAVPDAVADKDRINAMVAYDNAAEEYIRAFVSISDTFAAFDVSFARSDPGSVFAFPQGL